MKYTFALLGLFTVSLAEARPLEVNVRDYGWLTSFPALRDVLDFYLQGVENDINQEQPILNPSRLNYGNARSGILASKGLGTDYVNDPLKYQVSIGIGATWDGEKDVALQDEISGIGAASALSVGVRLNEKTMGFINLGSFTYSRILPTGDIDIAGDIKATNLGMHLRYDLMERRGNERWGWGGIKIHVGYEYNSNTVDLISDIDKRLEVDTGGAGLLEGRLTGKPTYTIKTRTHSVPLELSSSLFFLKILSFYGGFGADINYGRSKGSGKLKGDISSLACTSGICVGETVLPQLEAQANYDAVSDIRNISLRGFAGLQVDLPMRLHSFVQVEQMLGTEVIGVSAGLKYSF
jgi:hypothetical protein